MHAAQYHGRPCPSCGATKTDRQMGLEPTPDLFVHNMVELFREIRRVLAPHGTCWVNLGDSYATGGSSMDIATARERDDRGKHKDRYKAEGRSTGQHGGWEGRAEYGKGTAVGGLKPKDLCGIPWRVAFALQQPYYAGRIPAERDRAWLAAIIDGEGTICGMRHTRPNGNVRTGCMVFVTNTSEALLDECDRIWQGSRYSEKVTSEVSRPCWRWELQSAEDRSAITRELYPYLIEKKQQALVAWNLLEIVQAAKKLGRGGENDETKAKRDLLVRILSDLNQRRPVDLPSWLREPPTLHEPGWYLRSDVIWSKKNPMPESVTDRPTKAHEYVFLLTKQPRYWFDAEAVREASQVSPEHAWRYQYGRYVAGNGKQRGEGDGMPDHLNDPDNYLAPQAGRNVRSVWQIATQPYPEAHFATYPEELARRCILAGCPVRVCRVCGKPSERIVERTGLPRDRGDNYRHGAPDVDPGNANHGRRGINGAMHRKFKEQNPDKQLGWTECDCNDEGLPHSQPVGGLQRQDQDVPGVSSKWRPGVVLDPFIGSGTTAKAARDHQRHAIGIDLNHEYLELAARRLQQLSLFADAEPPIPLARSRGLTGGAYNPPGQSPHSNAR